MRLSLADVLRGEQDNDDFRTISLSKKIFVLRFHLGFLVRTIVQRPHFLQEPLARLQFQVLLSGYNVRPKETGTMSTIVATELSC
ncbi:hypothetical protein L596_010682 [Steinernema carpocapsae]|uniref:Uncharacterized protein n=1 Tax=Steinernema carpocapsae TaxID=34508 RepID=A0A4U5PJ73_STECR|nr:hypothetical protein L596_010682 [Steinernema carpocapsae]